MSSSNQQMLLDFLREHEASCPVCQYNLHGLTQPICPECGHELVLTVGTAKLRLGWLLASVAPGFFSGIAAFFVLLPTFGQFFGNGRRFTPSVLLFMALDGFGWCSLAFAILLARHRVRFLALPRARQIACTLGIWFVHVAALAIFILFGAGIL